MNKKELKKYMKSLVLRFGERIQCEWLDVDGCKWIPTKMEIDTNFLLEFEKGHIRNVHMAKLGVEYILFERERQVEEEGWDYEHDDLYTAGQLAIAGATYALPASDRDRLSRRVYLTGTPIMFPFSYKWWKPTPDDRIRELSKAGALIAAEIDRLQRFK